MAAAPGPSSRSPWWRAGAWLFYVAALAGTPFVLPSGPGLALASQIGIAIIACLSFNLMFGQGGMLSFGHAVYPGLGAYAAIHALNAASAGAFQLPLSLIPLVGGVAGFVVAALIGNLSTRRTGMSFAMITLAIGVLVFQLASMMTGFFGGERGVSGHRVFGPPFLGVTFGPQREVYYLIAAYTLACTLVMYALTRTPFGRVSNAVRDNPERSAFIGLSARRVRYRSFVIAGFFAGIAGGLYAIDLEIVTADLLDPAKSASLLLFTLLGGTTWFVGPIVGAVLMVLCSALLPSITKAWLLYVGLAFMAMMMIEPGGLAALAMRTWEPGAMRAARLDRAAGVRAASLGRTLSRVALGLAAFFAAATLIEMLYRVRLDASSGPLVPFLGMQLDTSSAMTWSMAIAVLVVATAAAALLRRGGLRRVRPSRSTPSSKSPSPSPGSARSA